VYTQFSNPQNLWDIQFILALNYNVKTKRNAYKQWFEILKLHVPYLTRELHYPNHWLKFLFTRPSLTSKIKLLQWLTTHYPLQTTLKQNINTYIHAIAHQTPEELIQLCGPLMKLL
jgi:hypothetical protein